METAFIRDEEENEEIGGEAVGAGLGTIGGALVGAALAGPPGMIVGGLLGAAAGGASGEATEGTEIVPSAGGAVAGAVAGAVIGTIVGGPVGTAIGAAVGAAGGAALGDQSMTAHDAGIVEPPLGEAQISLDGAGPIKVGGHLDQGAESVHAPDGFANDTVDAAD